MDEVRPLRFSSAAWRYVRAGGASLALVGVFFVGPLPAQYALLILALGAVMDDGFVPALYAVVLFLGGLAMWTACSFDVARLLVIALVIVGLVLAIRRKSVPVVDLLALCLVALVTHSFGSLAAGLSALVLGVVAAGKGSGTKVVPVLPFAAVAAVVAALVP